MKTIKEIEELLNDSAIDSYKEMVSSYLDKLNNKEIKVGYKDLAAAFLLGETKKRAKDDDRKPAHDNDDSIRFYAKKDTIYQRFFITMGKKDHIGKMDIVDFVKSKVEGITTEDFADVYVLDSYSFFELEASRKDEVIEKINNQPFNNHEIHIEFSEMRKPGNKKPFVKHDNKKFYRSEKR